MKKDANIRKVEEALNTIRPYLRSDGGDIELVGITKDMIVEVRLLGSCETCDVNLMTLENSVEIAIKHYLPESKGVISV